MTMMIMKPSKAGSLMMMMMMMIGLWTCHAAASAVDMPLNLIHQASTPPLTVHEDVHRDLQTEDSSPTPAAPSSFSDEFALPFQVIWNMAFSEETTIRRPQQDELTGLFYATLNWLLASARQYYSSQLNVMYLDRIQFTHYGASFNSTAAFPSTVGMECACYFKANNRRDIPSVFQFLVAFSANFNRTTFLQEYLANADPDTNIYRNVSELRYNIIPSSLGISGLEINSLTLNTEWKYEIGYGVPDRIPTDEEYDGLQAAYNDWLVHLFLDAYPPNPSVGDDNPEFHMLESTTYSRSFDTTQDPPQHVVRVLTQVSFRRPQQQEEEDAANDSTPLGITQQDLLNILNTVDLRRYRDNYLHWAKPVLSLFTGVLSMSWTPVET